MPRRKGRLSTGSRTLLLAAVTLISLMVCVSCWVVFQAARRSASGTNVVTLEIACSPEMWDLFDEVVQQFNAAQVRVRSGKRVLVTGTQMQPELMIDAALAGRFQALLPDSSVWLSQLELGWQQQESTETSIVGETARFAVSPIVIAMWQDVARSLGYPDQSIGWEDILAAAQSDPQFKWSHPSTSSASGLLATLATFYAGAGKTRGLTVEDATAESTLAYVATLEKTVRHYGEGELAVIAQIEDQGSDYLDAFVLQEQLVIQFNQRNTQKLVSIYPVEGAMWKDYPLVFLERPDTGSEQRYAYRGFCDFLLSNESQMLVLSRGYRPTDLTIPLDAPSSPITLGNGVDPSEPKTTLQIPSPAVIQVVRDAWQYTKRKTNVFLVADVSGSMQGEKLEQAQEAFLTFLSLIKGDQERVGLIIFSSSANEAIPLSHLSSNRQVLQSTLASLDAGGDTALLDAVGLAYDSLQAMQDAARINAIVVMTDGRENNSRTRLSALTSRMREGNQTGVPVVVFCVAYGGDADMETLEAVSEAAGGQTRRGTPETIGQLYKLLSTYF
jgi:Ca-activated chloride channel family protein